MMAIITSDITPEWLESKGFEKRELGYYVRHLTEGPADTKVFLAVGNFPFNCFRVTLFVGGIGVASCAAYQLEVQQLIRLFEGGRVDHPYEAWDEPAKAQGS